MKGGGIPMEEWEALCPGGYRFLRRGGAFPPGTDTFALSSLPKLRPGLRVCDLGCGGGLLGLLLLQREPDLAVTGVELSPDAAALAERTAEANGLRDRLRIVRGDLRSLRGVLEAGSYDLAVCNPPYYPVGSGAAARDAARRSARSEATCTLEEVCGAAAYLLRWGGAFCLVHKPERLADALCALRAAGVEAKRLRLVEHRAGAAASLALIEGRRGGKPGLTVEPALVLEDGEGRPTPEADAVYFRTPGWERPRRP